MEGTHAVGRRPFVLDGLNDGDRIAVGFAEGCKPGVVGGRDGFPLLTEGKLHKLWALLAACNYFRQWLLGAC